MRWLILFAALSMVAAAPDGGGVALLDRLTWGATEHSLQQLRSMGTEAWLQWQLHPSAADTLPPAAQAQIDAQAISRQSMPALVAGLVAQQRAANQITDPAEKQAAQQAYQQAMNDPARQAAARDILRDLYSPAQLRERMSWFWFNHFNVHQYKADIRPMVADYVEQAIRPHALGRFRDLLAATLRHPAMLRYLDNAENAAGHPNENYAREIMELHTMGVGAGYTQHDIEELARILSGLGIDPRPEDPRLKPELRAQLVRDGLFEFNPGRHDYGDKLFLGHTIKGSGLAEVDEALDILVHEPATARHVSQQIAGYVVADDPPPALVDRMAKAWTKSDGDIPSVLRAMIEAPEFRSAGARKFKDPVRYVISAVRLAYDDRVLLNTAPIQNWLNRMGEGLFNKDTPDGYPLGSGAWNGPGQLAVRFEVAKQLGSGPYGLFRPPGEGTEQQPGYPQLQNALYFADFRQALSPATRGALDQAVSPQDWNTLFLASPEFMQ